MCLAGLGFGTSESHCEQRSVHLPRILVAENNWHVCLSVCPTGGRYKTFKSPCYCENLGIRRMRVSANAFENILRSVLLMSSVGVEKTPPGIL